MKNYYSSNFLIQENILLAENIDKTGYYYEVEFISDLKCTIAKAFYKNQVKNVTFYDIDFSNELVSYVRKNFGNIKIIIYYNLSDVVKSTKIYNDGTLSSLWIYKYDNQNRLINSILYDEYNILVEYRESIYSETGNYIQEKIFFADSWTIHIEKMI